MTSLVMSDLHLGAHSRGDTLRVPELREPFLRAVEKVDEVVLLGDAIELRERPAWDAMAIAEPFFRQLGEAVGDGRVTLVPGNHDHALLAPWLDRRRRSGRPLGLAERIAPADASALAERIGEWVGAAETEVAYPGAWLRDDVFAMHGHHLDRHNTVPAFEVLAQRVVERWGRRGRLAGPDGYEQVFGPVFAASFAAAQRARDGMPDGAVRADASHQAWELLTAEDPSPGARLIRNVGIPAAIGALRLAGLGPIGTEISGRALRTAALSAMGEVVERLGIDARYLVFGHTHRCGPVPHDAAEDWRTASGAQLHNDGCWVYDPSFIGPGGAERNPYWPGRCLIVSADGPPERRGFLDDREAGEIEEAVTRPEPSVT